MPEHLLWCEEMFRLDINGFPEQPRLDTQKRQPIVKLATDLADELAHRPALAPRQRLISIKGARDMSSRRAAVHRRTMAREKPARRRLARARSA
jgi:hypothetical protein